MRHLAGLGRQEQIDAIRAVIPDDALDLARQLICPLCGKEGNRQLGQHVAKKHGVKSRVFKEAIGAQWTESFTSDDLRQIFRDHGLAKGEAHMEKMRDASSESGKIGITSPAGRHAKGEYGRTRGATFTINASERAELGRLEQAVRDAHKALLMARAERNMEFIRLRNGGAEMSDIARAAGVTLQAVHHVVTNRGKGEATD